MTLSSKVADSSLLSFLELMAMAVTALGGNVQAKLTRAHELGLREMRSARTGVASI